MVNKKKTGSSAKQTKPQRLTDKEMRELLTNLKKRADKTPEEDSFSCEVVCSSKDIENSKK